MKYIINKASNYKRLNLISSASLILLASCASGFAHGSSAEKYPGIFINNGSGSGGCIWTYDNAHKANIGVIENDKVSFGAGGVHPELLPTLAELGGGSNVVCGTGDKAYQTSRALFYGTDASAGTVSLTLGNELFVNGGNLGLGGGTKNRAMHIGSLATLDANSGMRALAIGAGEQATIASGDDSIAIGTNAQALHNGSVAIGFGSKTYDAFATPSMRINNQTYTVAGTKLAGTVSVGNVGAERTITNVGAGRVNALSTDAVNGSQLHSTNQEIAGLVQKVDQVKASLSRGNDTAVNYDQTAGGAKGNTVTLEGGDVSSPVSIKNVARGTDGRDAVNVSQIREQSAKDRSYTDQEVSKVAATAKQNGQSALASAKAYTDQEVAQVKNRVGANSTAIENNSQKIEHLKAGIDATSSSAVKYDLNDDGTNSNTVTLHGGDESAAVTIGNVAAGVNGRDAVNVDQLEGRLKEEAINNRSHTDQRMGEVKAHSDAADRQLNRDIQDNDAEILATNQRLDKTDEKLHDVDTFSVKYGQNEDGAKNNVVALQGGDPNAPVVLENVASGVKSNDAVNVGQLKDSMEEVSNKAHVYTDERIAHTRDYVDQKAQATLGQANGYTDEKFDQLSGEIVSTRKEARQAAAIGLAAASLRYDDRPGKLSVAAGGGFWRGESAFSAGMGYTNEEGKVRANVSATHAGGHFGVGAGISYTFN